ncbi:hypothetical protein HZ326_10913 [Fusarium oxysporum f. sp. albedinis]|nr:hypothetical protein HZ326_10913 [Fusarium oxysporum f. sp. albedinis]
MLARISLIDIAFTSIYKLALNTSFNNVFNAVLWEALNQGRYIWGRPPLPSRSAPPKPRRVQDHQIA